MTLREIDNEIVLALSQLRITIEDLRRDGASKEATAEILEELTLPRLAKAHEALQTRN